MVTVSTITSMRMTTEATLYRLMTWLSPAYPLGAFSYSHGLEYAVEAGRVRDVATLVDWVRTVIDAGAGRIDAALFTAAYGAIRADDSSAFDEVVELATAWRGTVETALESAAQGAAFVVVTSAAWPDERFAELAARHGGHLALPVAFGAACALHGIALETALPAYLQAFGANLISAGVRLIPLGQTDGQRAIAALEPVVAKAATAALEADLEELGTAAPLLDWCSIKHETQYTRLFRS